MTIKFDEQRASYNQARTLQAEHATKAAQVRKQGAELDAEIVQAEKKESALIANIGADDLEARLNGGKVDQSMDARLAARGRDIRRMKASRIAATELSESLSQQSAQAKADADAVRHEVATDEYDEASIDVSRAYQAFKRCFLRYAAAIRATGGDYCRSGEDVCTTEGTVSFAPPDVSREQIEVVEAQLRCMQLA